MSCLLRGDDGSLVVLRVFHCPEAEARLLSTIGSSRSVCCTVAQPRVGRCEPALRVDDAQTLHFDLTPAALLGAIGRLMASSFDPSNAVIESARALKDAGGRAFRRAEYDAALLSYGKALEQLLFSGVVVIGDYSQACLTALAIFPLHPPAEPSAAASRSPAASVSSSPPSSSPSSSTAQTISLGEKLIASGAPPPFLKSAHPDASALAVSLLTRPRAAAALRLGRHWRALADVAAAATLMSSPLTSPATEGAGGSGGGGGEAKASFRRAQALLAVGACTLAMNTLSVYVPREPELKALMGKAAARAESVKRRALGFRLVGGTTSSDGDVSGAAAAS